jgi:hypothetical protein
MACDIALYPAKDGQAMVQYRERDGEVHSVSIEALAAGLAKPAQHKVGNGGTT